MEVIHSATPLSLDQPIGGEDGGTLDPADEDDGFRRVDDQRAITKALSRLPERDQQIVRLRFEEELTQSEIAARLGVSQMCVSRALSRTLRRMHTHLAERPASDAPPPSSAPRPDDPSRDRRMTMPSPPPTASSPGQPDTSCPSARGKCLQET